MTNASHLRFAAGWLALLCAAVSGPAVAAVTLEPCRLEGIAREVACGRIDVPENRAEPGGRQIGIRFAVVPAMAKRKAADPVFVLAGGPGQAATRVAGQVQPLLAEVNAARDIVYVDQRGTGGSHPLTCERPERLVPVREAIDSALGLKRLRECLRGLDADTRRYATWIAMQDLDAVRAALGYETINLWGASYGTRAALEYLRQFPQRVRSVVLDGVAPPDMALPASFAVDADAALDRLLAACAADASCNARHPTLGADIDRLLEAARAGLTVDVAHPVTGQRETVVFDRAALAALLRAPLYLPSLAAVLPYALARAAADDFAPLVALSTALSGPAGGNLAEAMHFAVICAEDMPKVDGAAAAAAARTRFGDGILAQYRDACALLPPADVPAAFYDIAAADVPVLILSGGADPATPPRHAEAVARRLPRALHVVAPNLGHGVSGQGCGPDLLTRFIRQADFEGIDAACLERLPAPTFLQLPRLDTP